MLVRSDAIAVGKTPASKDARALLQKLPPTFEAGDLYIDYFLR